MATAALELAAAARKSAEPRSVTSATTSSTRAATTSSGRQDISPGFGERIYRWTQKYPTTLYFGGITIGSVGALTVLLRAIDPQGLLAVVMLLMALIPASEIGISIMNQLDHDADAAANASEVRVSRPRHSRAVQDRGRRADAVRQREGRARSARSISRCSISPTAIRICASRFSATSPTRQPKRVTGCRDRRGSDLAGIAVPERRSIREMVADVFYLFHRPRRWNPKQGVWMGWERKRGKLAEFNRFLRGQAADAFSVDRRRRRTAPRVPLRHHARRRHRAAAGRGAAAGRRDGASAQPRRVRSRARPRRARLRHPAAARRRVAAERAPRRDFAAIHSGHPGVDPYTTAVSDVLPGSLRRGKLHRERDLRRRRVRARRRTGASPRTPCSPTI